MECQYLAVTSFETSAQINVVEDFFLYLKADIKKSKTKSVTAIVEHPDGFDCCIKIRRYEFYEIDKIYMEATRRYGDGLLFCIIYKMFKAYIENGELQSMYLGQMCPTVKTGPQDDPDILPPGFCLDLSLKRKL